MMTNSTSFEYSHQDLLKPTLDALFALGNSGKIDEIEQRIIIDLNLSNDQVSDIHSGSRTKLNYNGAWARTYLKHAGVINNSERGVWTITDRRKAKRITNNTDPSQIIDRVVKTNTDKDHELEDENHWREELIAQLLDLTPRGFEKLCLRLLRELGFTKLKITGKPNDGGVDGVGSFVINEVLSFDVLIQAKRFKSSVGSNVVRDFRGALSGRAEKGLIITTGSFTPSARQEALREGSKKIDLIDGNLLCDKLAALELGVTKEVKTYYEVDSSFFSQF